MGSIAVETKKNGNKVYRANVRKQGQRLTKRFLRRTDAKDWMKDIETSIARGEQLLKATRYSLSDAIDRYILEALPHKKPSTQQLHRVQLEWFKDHLGHIPLQSLGSADLSKTREVLRQQPVQMKGWKNLRYRGASTLNRYFQPLLHLLNIAAKDWGLLQAVPRLSKLKEPKGRTRFLTPDEARKLFAALEKDNHRNVLHRLLNLPNSGQ